MSLPFGVTVTLTSDLVLRIIVFRAYLLYSSKFCVYMHLGDTHHFWVTVTLTSDLVLIIIVSGAYLLYYLR